MVAYRDKSDLDKSADRLAAQAKVFAEEPECISVIEANTVRVGKVSLTD